jgi:hypothetical protein
MADTAGRMVDAGALAAWPVIGMITRGEGIMTQRRRFIAYMAGGLLSAFTRARGSGLPDPVQSPGCSPDETAALLERLRGIPAGAAGQTTWIASATITLFSVPVFSRRGVGSGYAVIEQADLPSGGSAVSIQFGAGSWPEAAHGLNRFGVIHEVTIENHAGSPEESAYGAFITTSREKNMEQATQALHQAGATIPYIAAQAHASGGRFAARVDELEFPSRYTWRDADSLMTQVRQVVSHSLCPAQSTPGPAALFLYSVRRAMTDPGESTAANLFFNGKQFHLRTKKDSDAAIGAKLAERGIVARPEDVIRLDAVIREMKSGEETPFRVWYDAHARSAPPVRFEYQAKSFLRLVFEADSAARTPRFGFVW